MRAIEIVRHRRERNRRAAGGRRRLRLAGVTILLALVLLLLIPAAGVAAGAAGLLRLIRDLPDISLLQELPGRFQATNATTRLYAWGELDDDGLRRPLLIDEITDPRLEGNGWVRVVDLPAYVPGAIIAAVDPHFLSATEPDLAAALVEWWQTGAVSAPDSPIVDDLILAYLRDGATAAPGDKRRALQDWFLGRQISRRYSREQLLEWTLNTRYYGNLAYGIEAAARVYFGKGAADLTPGEAAMLAASTQFPAANPFDAPADAQRNRAAVLAAMVSLDMISPAEAAAAQETPPTTTTPPPGSDSPAPHFARLARRELEVILGPERLIAGGWQVETTLDTALQTQAICAASAHLAMLAGRPGASGGGLPCPARDHLSPAADGASAAQPATFAVVALDPTTGAIEALLGDAANASHPAGSLVRPLIYLTALSQGYTAATLTMDVPSIYLQDGRPYSPRNSDGLFRGPLRLREALAAGRAVPAAQVLSWVGISRVLETAEALGLQPDKAAIQSDLTFADMGFEATLLDLGHAFATVGNGGATAGLSLDGLSPRPATIRRIVDGRGDTEYVYEAAVRETLAPELSYLLNDILADREAGCAASGCPADQPSLFEGQSAVVSGEAAGSAWTIGYTPDRLIAVWAGGESVSEVVDTAPLWQALMSWSSTAATAAFWSPPAGLRRVEVCEISGLLPSRGADCPTIREWFVPGTEPATADTMVREVAINRENGRLATIFTPPQLIERRAFIDYPPEATSWVEAAGIEPPPAEYDTIRRIPTRNGAAELAVEPWSLVGRQESPWSVVGSAGGEDFAYYRLAYFPGLLPEAMQTLVGRGETPVEAAELGVWDTTLLADGLYTLLLTVVRQDGTFDEVAIPVTVANGE